MKIDFEKLPTDKIDRYKQKPNLNKNEKLLYFCNYGDETSLITETDIILKKDIIVTGYGKEKINR